MSRVENLNHNYNPNLHRNIAEMDPLGRWVFLPSMAFTTEPGKSLLATGLLIHSLVALKALDNIRYSPTGVISNIESDGGFVSLYLGCCFGLALSIRMVSGILGRFRRNYFRPLPEMPLNAVTPNTPLSG